MCHHLLHCSSLIIFIGLFGVWSRSTTMAAQDSSKQYIQFDHAPTSSRLIPTVIKYQQPHHQQPGRTHTRPARQLNSLTTTNLQGAASAYDYANEVEYGGYASAGSHGGGYGHGGGGGGGGGHGHGVNSSAVGLLGFLALLSLIQNILRQMTTTAAPGRRKRDADEDQPPDTHDTQLDMDRVTLHIIPQLVRIGQVLDHSAPLNCTLHALCTTNVILTRELGSGRGHFVSNLITDGVLSMLGTKFNRLKRHKKMLAEMANAAHVGRKGGSCDSYKKCNKLDPMTNFLPFLTNL